MASTEASTGRTSSDRVLLSENAPGRKKKDFRFYAILVVLSLASLLTALEATVTSTVLPVLATDLNAGSTYIWIANAYLVTL